MTPMQEALAAMRDAVNDCSRVNLSPKSPRSSRAQIEAVMQQWQEAGELLEKARGEAPTLRVVR